MLSDNRQGTMVNVRASQANGVAEREVAAQMPIDVASKTQRKTVGEDKACDTAGSVRACRELQVTPHVEQSVKRLGDSAIDGRTSRHEGYALSMRAKKHMEQYFGMDKTVAPLVPVTVQGLAKADQLLTLTTAAHHFSRLRVSAQLPSQTAQ